MVKSCAAYNCKSRWKKGNGLSFYSFPKDPEIKKQWVIATKRENFTPSPHALLCNKHFSKEQYQHRPNCNVELLRTDAVPTIFDFPKQLQKEPPKKTRTIEKTEIMADEAEGDDKPFSVDRAKTARAACKKCKDKIKCGELRIAKLAFSPFGSGKMKSWHHVDCIFELFLKQRATTKRLESAEEIDGWDTLEDEDRQEIIAKFEECEKSIATKYSLTYVPGKLSGSVSAAPAKQATKDSDNKDGLFREFRRLVADITNVSSYLDKTALVHKLFTKGPDGNGFKGDITQWCRLLLPGVIKRIYNLQSKQLVKLFSRIFGTNQDSMLEHLEQGDVGETLQVFHEKSKKCIPAKKSLLTIQEVDDFLEELSNLTKEDEQVQHFEKMLPKCTSNDLKIIIRLIKHDLRMNAGAKHVLDGVHPNAYEAYQASRDLKLVIERCFGGKSSKSITLLTPVLPMLAEACKSIKQAMEKCPNGMYSEIKYDGERVQLHKQGKEFRYYSRSLKPVMQHKIAHFKDYIPKAFPHGEDLILDSEILMVDTNTGMPLPFGTLGKHKKNELQDASVCLYVFDCIYYNGEDLSRKPIRERKRILEKNMIEIPNHVVFSEKNEIDDPRELAEMITKTIKLGLEGLVLKDKESIYEPGKRHWLKVKKDYLFEGAVADSADLLVLGAWYGTGKKGGIMSVFLMGVYDEERKKFCTVTKVHIGLDDKTLDRMQGELDMVKISKDVDKVPSWLKCTKTMVPDFVARDPKKQPVWEISGAEFSQQHDVHTADGISIRFPRITKFRDDKDWTTATNLKELNVLFKNSKENFDGSLFDKELEQLDPSKYKKRKNPTASTSKRKSDSTPSPSKKRKLKQVELINPLPDYFTGVRLKFDSHCLKDEFSELLRLFVAFSGTISEPCTHVLHKDAYARNKRDCPSSAKHIRPSWIEESILNEELVDERQHMVSLIPDSWPADVPFTPLKNE